MSTASDTGSAKPTPTTGAKLPKFPLTDALEFLRSGLHYVAKAGTPIQVENHPDGTLTITLRGIYYYEGARAGEIRFAPIPESGVPAEGSTPPSTPHEKPLGAGTPQSG